MAALNHPLGHPRRLPLPSPIGKPNWWVLSAVAIAGLSAMLPVLQNSAATSRGFDIQDSQATQARLNGEISLLESDVARLTSLSRIDRRAKEIGLGPSDHPIYITVDEAGPQPAKIPSEYLPPVVPKTDAPASPWRSLIDWLSLTD
ncbi:MAG: hypothetical protein C0506_05685 [Anaerolinea sp.]|nr:hypothetical protein [Anaerolinea sp.]